MFKKHRADAEPLVGVGHREGELGAGPATGCVGEPHVAADADELFLGVAGATDHQANVADEVELGEVPQLLRRQVLLRAHEAERDRLRTQPPEMRVQPFLVVGPDGAHADGGPVSKQGVPGVGAEVPRTREAHRESIPAAGRQF